MINWSDPPETLSMAQQSNSNESTQTVNKHCIYVNNLPEDITREDLKDIFVAYGNITLKPYLDKQKNYALVTYESQESASKAVEAQNDKPPLFLRCSMAKWKDAGTSNGPKMVVNKFTGGKKFIGRGTASHRANTDGPQRHSRDNNTPRSRNDENDQPGIDSQEAHLSYQRRQHRTFKKNSPKFGKRSDHSRSKSRSSKGQYNKNYHQPHPSKPRYDAGNMESCSEGALNEKLDNLNLSDRNATSSINTHVASFKKSDMLSNIDLEAEWQDETVKRNFNSNLHTNTDSNKYENRSNVSHKYENSSRVKSSEIHETASTLSSATSKTTPKCQTLSKVSANIANSGCRLKVIGNENLTAVYKKPFSKQKMESVLDNIFNKMETNSFSVNDVPGLRWGAGCAACGRAGLWQCARCRREHYCSRVCQLTHWADSHGALCAPAPAPAPTPTPGHAHTRH